MEAGEVAEVGTWARGVGEEEGAGGEPGVVDGVSILVKCVLLHFSSESISGVRRDLPANFYPQATVSLLLPRQTLHCSLGLALSHFF